MYYINMATMTGPYNNPARTWLAALLYNKQSITPQDTVNTFLQNSQVLQGSEPGYLGKIPGIQPSRIVKDGTGQC
jgi:hypothetical protein